jgi:uncharacterized membrane protein
MGDLMDADLSSTGLTVPQPDEISRREKEDAMGAYLMMFAAWGAGLPLPILNLIAAVIYFFINKKTSPFVAFHSYQSLVTQIPISLLNAGVIAWGVLIVSPVLSYTKYFWAYVIFVVLWNLLYMVFSIVACVQARKGRFYYFWIFGRIAFARYYGPGAAARAARVERNVAPEGF